MNKKFTPEQNKEFHALCRCLAEALAAGKAARRTTKKTRATKRTERGGR
jgi:hypothetical protein